MVRTVPAVAHQESVHDVLRVRVLEVGRRDRCDFGSRGPGLGEQGSGCRPDEEFAARDVAFRWHTG